MTMKSMIPKSQAEKIIFCLTVIAILLIGTCFIGSSKDLSPNVITILATIVGGLVGVLNGRQAAESQEKEKEE